MTIRSQRSKLPVPHAIALGVALTALVVPFAARGLGGAAPKKPAPAPTPAASATTAAVTPAAAAQTASPAPVATATAAAVPPKPKAPAATPIDAYRGLGSWVDIYDAKAWRNPTATVLDMKRNGVKTLYLETANSRTKYAIKDPASTATFIRAAHANGIKVVAWYLPDLVNEKHDYDRVAAAIRFRTNDGQRFDSFTLDIESPAVKSVSERNARLERLSKKMRALVGKDYGLGACIPSPVGLAKNGAWKFPYGMLANYYDVWVPMSYYTWHGKGNKAAYADTVGNMRILRAQKGKAGKLPVHLIGGLAEESSPSEVRAFVQAARETKTIGASFYTWTGTTRDHWKQLAAVK